MNHWELVCARRRVPVTLGYHLRWRSPGNQGAFSTDGPPLGAIQMTLSAWTKVTLTWSANLTEDNDLVMNVNG